MRRGFRETGMPLTSGSRPPGGDPTAGERRGHAAPSAGALPVDVGVERREGGAPDPAGEGAATSRARELVAALPDGWAELCAYGLACRRW